MRQCIRVGDNEDVCFETETGQLWFRGQNFPVYHYPVEDVLALYHLLNAHTREIDAAYQKALQDKHYAATHNKQAIPVAPSGHPGQEDAYDLTPGKEKTYLSSIQVEQ